MLANHHEWINSDKHLFGQPNTAYDFTSVDSRETAKKLTRLEEQKVMHTNTSVVQFVVTTGELGQEGKHEGDDYVGPC